MKRFILSFILFLGISLAFISCKEDAKANTSSTNTSSKGEIATSNQLKYDSSETGKTLPTTTVEWDRSLEDFGTVTAGEVLKTSFWLTNTGDQPLTITKASSTCGCTVPKVDINTPIKPGDKTEIVVQFDTRGKKGINKKPINISANVEGGLTSASIVANVEPKSGE